MPASACSSFTQGIKTPNDPGGGDLVTATGTRKPACWLGGLSAEWVRAAAVRQRQHEVLRRLIDRSDDLHSTFEVEDFDLLVIRSRGHPYGEPGNSVEFVDVVFTNLLDEDGHARVRALVADLESELMAEVERRTFHRHHALLEGDSFTVIRYGKTTA